MFNFLCILDRVQPIEPSETRGELQLVHSYADQNTVLNDDLGEDLHDIFQSLRTDLG